MMTIDQSPTVDAESFVLAARSAIQELGARYAIGMDTGRRDLFASIWTNDALFGCSELGLDCHGLSEILDYYDNGPAKAAFVPDNGSAVRLAGALTLTFDGDRADGVSEFIAVRRGDPSYFVYTFGRYEDTYLHTPDGWRIAGRTMVVAPVRKAP